MENRFKLRVSRMFRSSFASCRSKDIPDVIELPVFAPQTRQRTKLIELFSPKPRPFPSICRAKCSEIAKAVERSCVVAGDLLPRPKVSERRSLLSSADLGGRESLTASPILPLDAFYGFDSKSNERKPRKGTKKKMKKKKTHLRKWDRVDQLDSLMAGAYNGWYSSDEDDSEMEDCDETTLFSSKSLSSDSSVSLRRNRGLSRRKPAATRRRRAPGKDSEAGPLTPLQGKVKESFAVVKRSSDPYNDFRTSMVEMIVEKQIFSAMDLENLLQCFLSLNSYHHHRVIIEVFTEIWETLFSDWS